MFVRLSAAIAAVSLFGSAALAQGAKPTDPQIAHIAYTAGVIDIAAAKQALTKTSNKEVKAFAQDMVRDHEAVNKQALDLVKKLKVTPEDNDTSRHLSKQRRRQARRARQAEGRGIRQGLCRQRSRLSQGGRQRAGDTLIPGSSNAELKSLLQTGLKIFQGHEQHAEHVAASAEVRMPPMTPRWAFPIADVSDVGNVRPGAGRDASDHDGESRVLAGGGFGQGRRHHRMDQQGHLRPHRDGAKRRLGRDDAAEEDRHARF